MNMSYRTVSASITRLAPEELTAITRPSDIDGFIMIIERSPSSHPAASVSSNQSPASSSVFCSSSPARSVICLGSPHSSESQSVIDLGSPARSESVICLSSPAWSDSSSVICIGSPAWSDSSSVICIGSPPPLRAGIDTPFSPSNSEPTSELTYTPLSDVLQAEIPPVSNQINDIVENNDDAVTVRNQENVPETVRVQAEIHHQQNESDDKFQAQSETHVGHTNDISLVEPPELLHINGYYYERVSHPVVKPAVSRGKPWAQLVLDRNKELLDAEKKGKRKAKIPTVENEEQIDMRSKKRKVEEMTHQRQQPHAPQQQPCAQQQQQHQSYAQQQPQSQQQQQPRARQRQQSSTQQQQQQQSSTLDPNYRIPKLKLKLKLQKNESGEGNSTSSMNFDELTNPSASSSGEFQISSISDPVIRDHASDDLSDTDLSRVEFDQLIKIHRKNSR
ncbi:hypothetical protein QAD02_018514 [Eretmocerus hayati]|uniref:Uncharacterized protein n=1 Tax=Eretmocerus hayati TaxID=131215 RepID=A0ACC2PJY6_9HYME|nr:hypothetical protein QAD02_018514 [Eretmocerus hayati]